ncbi:hypothetical protein [Myxococcus sp. Y35]|uniref:hypothetical protein n=1 Tax=Pseudomyxococcus flavus TaxID=3115648 RepID=UPI003CF2616A
MSPSDPAQMNRRWFLRAGTLLGLGAGGVLTARTAEAGVSSKGSILTPPPAGTFDERWGAVSEIRGVRKVLSPDEALWAAERPPMSPEPVYVSEAGLASFQVHFYNNFNARIWICISFEDPANCSAWGGWGTRGWWSVDPGQSVYVLNTTYPEVCFYAETGTGWVWTAEDHHIFAPQTAFSSCLWNQRIGDRYLGMRRRGLVEGPNTFTLQ